MHLLDFNPWYSFLMEASDTTLQIDPIIISISSFFFFLPNNILLIKHNKMSYIFIISTFFISTHPHPILISGHLLVKYLLIKETFFLFFWPSFGQSQLNFQEYRSSFPFCLQLYNDSN